MHNTKLRNKAFFSILAMIVCILFGCEKKDALVLSEMQNTEAQMQESFLANETTEIVNEAQDSSGMQTDVPEEEKAEADIKPEDACASEVPKIIIHICGAVHRPGVYELKEGDRICQAIEKAGGFTNDADRELLNQAGKLVDGMQLIIPTEKEAVNARMTQEGEAGFLHYDVQRLADEPGREEDVGLININTATEEALCTLPGIGSEKAKSIIAYRKQNGNYQRIEDIMNVTGIKQGMYDKIKDKITV